MGGLDSLHPSSHIDLQGEHSFMPIPMTTEDLRATKGFLEERMNRKSEWYSAVRKGRGGTDIGMAKSLADPKKVA